MKKRDEFELRIVESTKPLSTRQPARPRPLIKRRSAPTRAEALEALQAAKGAPSLIESLPMLGQINRWSEAAYWDVCKAEGSAIDGAFLWDCDFPGTLWNIFDSNANCIAYFAGAEDLGGIIPPDALTGQVWCYLDVPARGNYLFVAQVLTYLDQFYSPDYEAVIECFIDDLSLGTRTLLSGQAYDQAFLVILSPGLHRFQIKQVTGALFFESLTAWTFPLLENPVSLG